MFGLKFKNKNDKIWLIISINTLVICLILYLYDFRVSPSAGAVGLSIGTIHRIIYFAEFPL